MLNLIESILNLSSPPNTFANEVEQLLADLVGAWNVVCRFAGNMDDLPSYESTMLDWSNVPRITQYKTVKAFRQDGIEKCFGLLTPSFYHRHTTHLPAITISTFALLSHYSSSIAPSDVQHLKDVLARVLSSPGLNIEQYASRASRSSHWVVYEYACTQWNNVEGDAGRITQESHAAAQKESLLSDSKLVSSGTTTQDSVQLDMAALGRADGMSGHVDLVASRTDNMGDAVAKSTAARTSMESIAFRNPVERKTRVSIQSMRTRLDKAVGDRDVEQANQLWATASEWRFQPRSNEDKLKKQGGSVLTVYLLNKFIYSFMALRQPNRAIDVWNAMMRNGVRPDIDAWNAMLSGGRISRDGTAFDKIWQQMCSRNVGLNKDSWNIRIGGLIDMWKVQDGLRTLDEMGHIWLCNAKTQHPKLKQDQLFRLEDTLVRGAVKPGIETVNMTVAALLKKKKADAVRPVLTWATRFGIAPSAFTYNVLLRPLIRSGDTTAAKALIQEMKVADVSPDAGTFVTIIDETLRAEDEYTAEEQANAINQIFQEMEAAGLEPTQGLYGHIIHGLIDNLKKHGSTDLSVVNTVMTRMASQGWQPGSVEYTELAKFLFDQYPPDIAGVDALIARSRLNAKSLNHVFWDSVLEGYARTGETAKAMQVYQESKQKGGWQADHSKIAWRAHRELLMALTRDGDWDTAKAVVAHKILENGGVVLKSSHDTRTQGHVSQFAFWELARSLNLLEKE